MNAIGAEKVLDLLEWQKVQDSIAEVSGLAIITVDYRGEALTKHSSCTAFCSRVRENEKLLAMCQKCDSRGGLEALRSNQPYAYFCHFNLVDVAIPIIIYDKYVGSIMLGQVRIENDAVKLESVALASEEGKSNEFLEKYEQEYKNVQTFTYDRLAQVVNMVDDIMKYMIYEIIKNNPALVFYDKTERLQNEMMSREKTLRQAQMNQLSNIEEEMARLMLGHYIQEDENLARICKTKTLKPAFEYIQKNKHEKITMANMAKLCHLSESHFSRIFAKEVGESFSIYISKLKVSWAKQLLEKTDMTVSQIAGELGYSEPGYFIKIFKKYEGITPALYQRYHYLAR